MKIKFTKKTVTVTFSVAMIVAILDLYTRCIEAIKAPMKDILAMFMDYSIEGEIPSEITKANEKYMNAVLDLATHCTPDNERPGIN